MDRPDSDPQLLERTLDQFSWINPLLSASRRLIRRYIFSDLDRTAGPATLLDVGAGGCDTALWLVKQRPALRVTCLDHDPRVVAYARRRCAGEPRVEVLLGSAEELGGEPYDYVFAGHFLHHLPETKILPVLNRMLRCARRVLLVNDLLRSRAAYSAYAALAVLFLHGSFAAYDGKLSIRKGFLPEELRRHAGRTEQPQRLQVVQAFPWRVCLVAGPARRPARG